MVDFTDEYEGLKDSRLNLQLAATEAALLNAAAQIYAANITAGNVSEDSEARWMKKSIKQAIAMGDAIDEMIKAEDEF